MNKIKIEPLLKVAGGLGVLTFGPLIAAILLDKTKDEGPPVLFWAMLAMLTSALMAKIPMVFGRILKPLNAFSLGTLVFYWIALYFSIFLGKMPVNQAEGNVLTPVFLIGLSVYWWIDLLTLY